MFEKEKMRGSREYMMAVGGSACFVSVVLGAFGAHALKSRYSADSLEIWETACRYQMYHGLAILICSALYQQQQSQQQHSSSSGSSASSSSYFRRVYNSLKGNALQLSIHFFSVGVLLFSGSLYLLVLTNTKWLGAVTPFGGFAMLIGWVLLVLSACGVKKEVQQRSHDSDDSDNQEGEKDGLLKITNTAERRVTHK